LALRALEHLARSRAPVGVTELAEALGSTKTRVHRHLRTLVQQGYITQAPHTGRYQIGTRLITLGRHVADGRDLSSAAHPHLRDLRDRLGQSCVLSQFEEAGARIVLALPGRAPIEIGVKPGSLLSFHNSAQGKAMLALADDGFREDVLSRPLTADTPATMTEPAALRSELASIRERGWAVAPNEAAMGLNALAAPLMDEAGSVAGAIAIVDLVQFLPAKPAAAQLDAVLQAAAAISADLGFSQRIGRGDTQARHMNHGNREAGTR
jgi:DNA-binding IclR family transcriptional regulator